MEIEPGQRIGSYEIISFLGEGAMGAVYRARDGRLGREVALKILHEEHAANQKLLHRFEREAHSASALNHPNIVTIYEVGHFEAIHFIAMEYVKGERLRDLLRREPLSLQAIVRIASGMVEGLAVAHSRGIVHRDLKPENIMLSDDGFVKILDFGLAKPFHTQSDPSGDEDTLRLPSDHTGHGTVVGTPNYMSPEQVGGEKVDHRSDQFSFGAILFEMISRRRPFDRPTAVETMTAILRAPAPRLNELVADVPRELDRIVSRCLSKEPLGRYTSTVDLAHDFRDLKETISLTSDRTPRPRPALEPRPRRIAAIASAMLILAVVAVLLFVFRNDLPTGTTELSSAGATLLPRERYLAVLPFEDMTKEPGSELYAKGTAETISIRLAALPGIQVIPPSAAQDLSGDLASIARRLGANLVLRGSVRRSEENLRINYMVMDPESGVQIAAGTVNGSTRDPFLIEDRLADSILNALELELGSGPSGRTNQGLLDAAQQERYLRALGALQRYENGESVDLAIDLLESLDREAPGSALVGAALGRAFLYKFQLTHEPSWADRAIEVSEAALRRDPALPEIHTTYGEVLTRIGRHEEAILRFRQALSERPDSAEAMLGLAEALDRAGEDDEAKRTYGKAISLRPLFWGGYNKLGVYYYRRGELEQAVTQFRRVVDLTPDNARAYSNLGAIDLQQGRFELAAANFRKSLGVSETSPGWSNLGTALYYTGSFEEAADAFEKAVALTPDNYILWMNLGDACRWSGDSHHEKMREAYARGIGMAESAVARDPGSAPAHVALAAMYAKTGERERASTHAERAVALGPGNPDVLVLASIVAHIAGEDARTMELLSRSVAAGAGIGILQNEPELAELRANGRLQQITRGSAGRTGS